MAAFIVSIDGVEYRFSNATMLRDLSKGGDAIYSRDLDVFISWPQRSYPLTLDGLKAANAARAVATARFIAHFNAMG